MAQSELYKQHLICTFAQLDAGGYWRASADISWGLHGDRGLHRMAGPTDRFKNDWDAHHFILLDARYWIDTHPHF